MSESKKTAKTKVIAYRRSCKATGDNTGLSHYVFLEEKSNQATKRRSARKSESL